MTCSNALKIYLLANNLKKINLGIMLYPYAQQITALPQTYHYISSSIKSGKYINNPESYVELLCKQLPVSQVATTDKQDLY